MTEPRSDAVTTPDEPSGHVHGPYGECLLCAAPASPDEPSLRHAAKNVLDLIDNGTEGGDGDTPLYDLLADEAREDVEVLRSVVMDESRLTAYERGWRDGVREARAASPPRAGVLVPEAELRRLQEAASASVPPLDASLIALAQYLRSRCDGCIRHPELMVIIRAVANLAAETPEQRA